MNLWLWQLGWIKFNLLLIEIKDVHVPNPPHTLPLTHMRILLSNPQETS